MLNIHPISISRVEFWEYHNTGAHQHSSVRVSESRLPNPYTIHRFRIKHPSPILEHKASKYQDPELNTRQQTSTEYWATNMVKQHQAPSVAILRHPSIETSGPGFEMTRNQMLCFLSYITRPWVQESGTAYTKREVFFPDYFLIIYFHKISIMKAPLLKDACSLHYHNWNKSSYLFILLE